MKTSKVLFLILFLFSCGSENYYFYNLDGTVSEVRKSRKLEYRRNNRKIDLYLDRSEIKKKYKEIKIIALNTYYYGNFYYDQNFMRNLNKKASLIRADALIFENDFTMFPHYNKDHIYFTAIKYGNK